MKHIENPCPCLHLTPDTMAHISASLPPEDSLYELADFFKVFADSTRIRMLYTLSYSEMCVCDLAEMLSMNASAISHQLRTLKQMKLVRSRREGKTVFYALADDHIKSILAQGMEHVDE